MKLALLYATLTACVLAQNPPGGEQRAEELRNQLRMVTEKQAELQGRLSQLEEDLKSENIQRSVAGIGTTDASALREQRRQELEREKAHVEGQLRDLESSRTRLDASIASAEAEAVRSRAAALGESNAPVQTSPANVSAVPSVQKQQQSAPQTKKRIRRRTRRRTH